MYSDQPLDPANVQCGDDNGINKRQRAMYQQAPTCNVVMTLVSTSDGNVQCGDDIGINKREMW